MRTEYVMDLTRKEVVRKLNGLHLEIEQMKRQLTIRDRQIERLQDALDIQKAAHDSGKLASDVATVVAAAKGF